MSPVPLHASINASLNAASAVLLVLGYAMIRRHAIFAHRTAMLSACLVSLLFLISYLTYHCTHGMVRFPGHGVPRAIYLTTLVTHTILAAVNLPLVLRTLYLALRGRFDRHKMWARWTLPIWLYVSVTGVVVYWMLYRMSWA